MVATTLKNCDILKGKKLVGFIMITYDAGEDDAEEPGVEWLLCNSCFIWRFMIDRRYQGNGCDREAMKPAPEFTRTFLAWEAKQRGRPRNGVTFNKEIR